jgi:hypothetical protein
MDVPMMHFSGRSQWTPPLCRLSVVFFVMSGLLLWCSVSISKSSQILTAQHKYKLLLLPGFTPRERRHHPRNVVSGRQHGEQPGAAAEAQQQPQQPLTQVSHVPDSKGPPHVLPKLIHQTVKDKNNMSCEAQESIQSWIDLNPGYTHILYDDADLLAFVMEHYPDLLPVYNSLPFNIEHTDTWRYLVLHKLGGVYADSDVKCMQPISDWNKQHGFDAALMVGIAKRNMRTGDTQEFNQFVMAAMPGHPVLATMPMVISRNLAYSHLAGLPLQGKGRLVDDGILMRTGPQAFTSALEAYARRVGAKWPVNSTQADLEGGVLFGSVRAMPKFVLGTGWDTLDLNMTCEEVKEKVRPEALICHQFFGTWKTRPEKQLQSRTFTYGDCNRQLDSAGADSGVDAQHDRAAQDGAEPGLEDAATTVGDAGGQDEWEADKARAASS